MRVNLSRRSVLLVAFLSLGWGAAHLPALVVFPGARAELALLNNDSSEHFACMYGGTSNGVAVVTHVEPGFRTSVSRGARYWVTEIHCPPAALGLAHNHPYGERCWYYFPTTIVPTSDEVSFRSSGTALSVIVCGSTLVWETK